MNKQKLHATISEILSDKKQKLESYILDTRLANNDTKSSMGDKYETGREMLQQEINTLQMQVNEVVKQIDFLQKMPIKNAEKVEKGALVTLENGVFYISVSLGEVEFENKKIRPISPESPLAKAMMGMKKGDGFYLNQNRFTILSID